LRRVAASAGVAQAEFWELTPRELGLALDGAAQREDRDLDRLLTAAWHGAAFERAKRLPKLDRVLRRGRLPKSRSRRSADSLLAKVRAVNAALGGLDMRR